MDRHFTVSVFIVYRNKVLLHLHKKANKILPLGGHIEKNELPQETCIREAKEECGLDINIFNPLNIKLDTSCKVSYEKLLLNPVHMILEEVANDHFHIDFIYYATSNTFITEPLDGESKILKWYTKEDLKDASNIQNNIVVMANEALDLLSEN